MSAALLSELVLPPSVAARLWRGSDLERRLDAVLSSGHRVLDKELPGGGWPSRALTELLAPQPAILEWRLLGPALQQIAARVAPDAPVSQVAERIRDLNKLDSAAVDAGQTLIAPIG